MHSAPEELVVIRTYADEFAADAAQAELHNAGIQSLLLAGGPARASDSGEEGSIGLAVHRRDVKLAEAVLLITPSNPA